jgi:hypothetical protein
MLRTPDLTSRKSHLVNFAHGRGPPRLVGGADHRLVTSIGMDPLHFRTPRRHARCLTWATSPFVRADLLRSYERDRTLVKYALAVAEEDNCCGVQQLAHPTPSDLSIGTAFRRHYREASEFAIARVAKCGLPPRAALVRPL